MIHVNATMMKHWKIFRTEFGFSREVCQGIGASPYCVNSVLKTTSDESLLRVASQLMNAHLGVA
ncbi:unnamed protein product [Brassica oleracea]